MCVGGNGAGHGNVNFLPHLQQQGLFAMETREKEEGKQHKHCALCVCSFFCFFFRNKTGKGHLQMKWNISYLLITDVTFPSAAEPLAATWMVNDRAYRETTLAANCTFKPEHSGSEWYLPKMHLNIHLIYSRLYQNETKNNQQIVSKTILVTTSDVW